jgi:hypothetical protein
MEPIETMVQRAAVTLVRLYETRSETVLKSDDVEMMRECVRSAAWMGMPSDQFRRTVIDSSQTILNTNEIRNDAGWHTLDSFFQRIIDTIPR